MITCIFHIHDNPWCKVNLRRFSKGLPLLDSKPNSAELSLVSTDGNGNARGFLWLHTLFALPVASLLRALWRHARNDRHNTVIFCQWQLANQYCSVQRRCYLYRLVHVHSTFWHNKTIMLVCMRTHCIHCAMPRWVFMVKNMWTYCRPSATWSCLGYFTIVVKTTTLSSL